MTKFYVSVTPYQIQPNGCLMKSKIFNPFVVCLSFHEHTSCQAMSVWSFVKFCACSKLRMDSKGPRCPGEAFCWHRLCLEVMCSFLLDLLALHLLSPGKPNFIWTSTLRQDFLDFFIDCFDFLVQSY